MLIQIYFSSLFIEKLSLLMRETNFSEGEEIYSDSNTEQNLYYIIKGTL